jgi:hypothetical protein
MPLIESVAQTAQTQAIVDLIEAGSNNPAPLLQVYDGATMIAECAISVFDTVVDGFAHADVADDTGVSGTPETYVIVDRDEGSILSGSIDEIPYSLVDGTFTVLGGLRITSPAFQVCDDEMGFVTESATFQPIIEVTGTPTILWTFADGSTSDSATPAEVDYGTTGVRLAKLKVTPWSSVTAINFGYYEADGGVLFHDSSYVHPDQRCSEIINLHLVKTSLVRFFSCSAGATQGTRNLIKVADFTGFVALRYVEFHNSFLRKVSFVGCNLIRCCVEGCDLTELDLTESTNIVDIRGASNEFSEILLPNYAPSLNHLCINSNNNLLSLPPMSRFPALRDLWVWRCNNLSHDLVFDAANTEINSVSLYECGYTTEQLDAMLGSIAALNVDGVGINIEDNAETVSSVGLGHISTLVSQGWQVQYTTPSQLSTPTFDPVAGSYGSEQTVTITYDANSESEYYRIDGGSWVEYTAPITVSSTQLVEAYSTAAGYTDSAVGSANYTITNTLSTPTFDPVAGSYGSEQTVTILFDANSESEYYRIDGGSWVEYTAPITVSTSQLVEAYSTATGYDDSSVGSANYTIEPQLSTPTFDPVAGTYGEEQTVTITYDVNSESEYYRIDGGSWVEYTAPITVSSTQLVEAYSTAAGYTDSTVGSANYTINTSTTVRIDFTTTSQLAELTLGPVAVNADWYMSDGTVYTNQVTIDHDFGSSGIRQSYVIINNPSDLFTISYDGENFSITRFVVTNGNLFTNSNGVAINNFDHQSVSEWGFTGVPLDTVTIGYSNANSPSATDHVIIAAAAGGRTNNTMYINSNRTSASDEAWATLQSRGWGLNLRD